MVLIDSCVWIDLLKKRLTPAVQKLLKIQKDQTPEICISSIVYFEVLRGIRSDLERKKVQHAFDLLERRDYLNKGFDRLTILYRAAERKGHVVTKLGDWLIIKTVLDHSLTLLTSDKDFLRLQEDVPIPLELLSS